MKEIKIHQDDGQVLTIFDDDDNTDYKELSKQIMDSKNIAQISTSYSLVTIRPSKIISIVVEDAKNRFHGSSGSMDLDENEDIITDGD